MAACLCTPLLANAQSGGEGDGDVVTIYGDRDVDDPGSVSVIDAEQIAAAHADHPAEILNTAPGVNIHMNSGQELLVAIRSPVLVGGAGQGSFLILENGVPIRSPAFGNVNALFEVHHEIAEAIEVVRGPGSVKYGSNAVHGLINVIAPEPDPARGSTLVASANTLQRYRLDASANWAEGDVDYFSAISLTDDAGWRSASGVDMQKLTFRSKYRGEDWTVVSSVSGVNLNQETAGFIEGADAYKDEDLAKSNPNPEAYRDAWAARASVRFSRDTGRAGRLTITPFGVMQRMIFAQHFLPYGGEEKNGQDSLGLMTRYEFGDGAVRWTTGADVQWADGFLREIQARPTFGFNPANDQFPQGVHYDFDVETVSLAAYAEANWRISNDWRVVAGVRAESQSYDYVTHIPAGVSGRFNVPPSREDNYDLLTPKLGVVYGGFGDSVELYANYARGARAPQASDQYRLQNLQTLERLDVETLDSVEVGARGRLGPVTYDVAAYAMKKDNFFFRDADGLNVPDGKTDHFGVEAQLGGAYANGVFWNASMAWSDQTYAFDRNVANVSEVIVDGAQIDTAPEWLGDFGLGWRKGGLEIYGWGEYVGEYFTNAANTASYPGHTVLNLRGSYAFSDALEAFLIVRNVADERYADRADYAFGSDRYFPGEPLNATLGVRVKR